MKLNSLKGNNNINEDIQIIVYDVLDSEVIDREVKYKINRDNISLNIDINLIVDNLSDIKLRINIDATKCINCKTELNINCILVDNSKVVIFPELSTTTNSNILNHKVSMGSMSSEQKEYLLSKGLSIEEIFKIVKESYINNS